MSNKRNATMPVRSDPAPKPEIDPDLAHAVYYAAALVEALSEVPDAILKRIDPRSPFTARMCHVHAVLTDTLMHLGIQPPVGPEGVEAR